jgi:hypothetical protein
MKGEAKSVRSPSARLAWAADPTIWTWLLIAIFVTACIGLSAGKDLWLDELFTWYQVKDKSFLALREATKTGFNLMPLGYFSLLWGFDRFGLLTVWTARLLSIGAAVGGVLVMARLWRRWWGAEVALALIGILVGSSAPLLTMAVEVRPYAISFLLATISLDCGCRFLRGEIDARLWGLNAGCSFALPFVSYPAGAYSAALALAVALGSSGCSYRRRLGVMASYATGWVVFLVIALPTLREQTRSNPVGIRNAVPHVPELLGTYSTLVWFPLAIAVALGVVMAFSRQPEENAREEPANSADIRLVSFAVLSWLLVPLAFFILAKMGGPTIWGERFFLPTAAAVVTIAGPLLAALRSRGSSTTLWPIGVGLAAVVSILAMAATFWRANQDAPVRGLPSQLTSDVTSVPIVVREMNTYFHLLYYGGAGLDLRLFADSQSNRRLLNQLSLRLKPVIEADLWQFSSFAVVVDGQDDWTNRIAADLARHHLTIAERHPVSNAFVREIWVVRKLP